MIFPKNFESKIDFSPLRVHLLQLCVSKMGEECVNSMRFVSDKDLVCRMLEQTAQMLAILTAQLEPPLQGMHDCTSLLNKLSVEGSYASAQNLMRICSTLRAACAIKKFFSACSDSDVPRYPHLNALVQSFNDFPHIIKHVESVIDSVGEVRDNASIQLLQIRRNISALQSSMSTTMRRAVDKAISHGLIEPDAQPVMRDGRLLLPVPAASRRSIPGIVFDESATGKTVFILPTEILESENKLHALRAEEHKEIVRILVEVADVIRPSIPELADCWSVLGVIDFIHAKALLARELDSQMPTVDSDAVIEIYNARHPSLILSFREQEREVIPLNLKIDDKHKLLLVSGPNAGGKSVALKTFAVVQYMMQCGMLPTVRSNSHMSVFKNIFLDLGDEQSIQNDLSTYSSHLSNMKYMLKKACFGSLILIDEIGSGTEPAIGAALARSIMLDFIKQNVRGIVTTHYDSLKQFASRTDGMQNAAMLYDSKNMQPLFKLQQGMAGSSFALQIAKKIGLPKHILECAEKNVGKDYVAREKYLMEIAQDRKYQQHKRIEVDKLEADLKARQAKLEVMFDELKKSRDEILRLAKSEAATILSSANARIEKTIRDIKSVKAEKEQTREVRKQFDGYIKSVKKQIETSETAIQKHNRVNSANNQTKLESNKVLQAGDFVKTKSSNIVGQIINISGNMAEAMFGPLRMKVKVSELIPAKPPRKSAVANSVLSLGRPSSDDNSSRSRQLNFTPNIDVRGMSVDEAIQAVTYFIDDAVQFEISPVRILHGTGTGALRAALRQYLVTIPSVISVRDEDIRFGGVGISVVTLDD